MVLKVNSQIKEFPENVNILKLLEKEDVIEPVAVEVFVNGKRVNFEDFGKFRLRDGDEVEYIYLFSSG